MLALPRHARRRQVYVAFGLRNRIAIEVAHKLIVISQSSGCGGGPLASE
jgi:hypothetical protein